MKLGSFLLSLLIANQCNEAVLRCTKAIVFKHEHSIGQSKVTQGNTLHVRVRKVSGAEKQWRPFRVQFHLLKILWLNLIRVDLLSTFW